MSEQDDVYFQPPRRHWAVKECSFENFNPKTGEQEDAYNFLSEFEMDSEKGLYLHGKTGTGKTHLLVATARRLKEQDVDVSYADGLNLWQAIRKNIVEYRQDNGIVSADVAIMDDIEIRDNDAADSKVFYHLIRQLYDKGMPVIISSNLSPNDFVSKMVKQVSRKAVSTASGGEMVNQYAQDIEKQARTLDRLNEMYLFIDLGETPSHREFLQKEYKNEIKR